VKLSILVPIVLIIVGLFVFWRWYRRTMSNLAPDSETRALPGARLTAERLRQLSSPPWRIVYEAGGKLGEIDHVVIGPTGVIAIETSMMDRPEQTVETLAEAQQIANAAIARGAVDDLTRQVGVACNLHAKVYWGTPQPDQPAGLDIVTGQVSVEGQRLEQWIVARPPGPLTPAQVDQVWQTILVGIGRPDPLA
jgi:Nuclease-related domain